MAKARVVKIREGHPAQIPAPTLKRTSRMVDAAILFIHGDVETGERVTQVKDLGAAVGLDARTIAQCMQSDRWEEFRLDLYAIKRREMANGELGMFTRKRSPEELRRISDEKDRQIAEIPVLQEEAGLIMKRIEGSDPVDKHYQGLLASLKKVEEMLEKRTGKEEIDKEEMEMRGGLMKLAIERAKRQEKPQPKEGEADPAKVIEI